MEPHDRRLTNVPLEATHFAWAFPLSGVAEAHNRDAIVARTREEACSATTCPPSVIPNPSPNPNPIPHPHPHSNPNPNPNQAFALYGGFVYLNENSMVIAANP